MDAEGRKWSGKRTPSGVGKLLALFRLHTTHTSSSYFALLLTSDVWSATNAMIIVVYGFVSAAMSREDFLLRMMRAAAAATTDGGGEKKAAIKQYNN